MNQSFEELRGYDLITALKNRKSDYRASMTKPPAEKAPLQLLLAISKKISEGCEKALIRGPAARAQAQCAILQQGHEISISPFT